MPPRKDWKKLLQPQIIKDNAVIITEIPDKINRDFRVKFKCNCGVEYDKTIRKIIERSGLYCKNCSEKNRKRNIINTLIKKYDITNLSQNKKFQQKKIETWEKNYGVSNPSQSSIIKQKKIETYKKNYGVENPMQSEEIQEKTKQTLKNKYGFECLLTNHNWMMIPLKCNLKK